MLRSLKNHNDSLLVVFLIFLLGGSTWVFSQNIEQQITLLSSEVQKIDKQQLFFTKQNNDLQKQKDIIIDNINNYVQLEKNLSENNTEEIKKQLAENTKSNELLAILPPSEIAHIQQKELLKTINEDIATFKDKSAFVWQSISQLNSEEFNDNAFSLGNIKDDSVKNIVSQDIVSLLKKEKPIFTSIATLDHDIEKFATSTENFKQFYPLLSSHQEKNKKTIISTINSLSDDLATIQLVASVGLVCLILLLVFVIVRKKYKNKTAIDNTQIIEQPIQLDNTPPILAQNSTDQIVSLFNDLNQRLSKHINLHFDTETFNHLPVEKQEKISCFIQEFIKFSLLYSFDKREAGDVIIYLREEENHIKLIFKDNGKGIFIEDIKLKIKQQYSVTDNVFVGKSEQQLLSFIFKPGFKLMQNNLPDNFDLSVINHSLKDLLGTISINSQENNGVEIIIHFPQS